MKSEIGFQPFLITVLVFALLVNVEASAVFVTLPIVVLNLAYIFLLFKSVSGGVCKRDWLPYFGRLCIALSLIDILRRVH
jgi:hypothetical protein